MMEKPGSFDRFFVSTVLIPVARRSFVLAWQTSMKIHEMMAENRLRFAQRLNEMSDELNNLAKEVDRNRKQVEWPKFLIFY
jgi:ABC-type Zn2+ transport system substrate-binding protein/surface adhesin